LSKGVTRAPADNFRELKMNIATFMSLVWVLFGLEWDYNKGLRNIYAMLESKEVMAQKNSFMTEQCRKITWAILDDGQTHFDDVKTTFDFRGPDEPAWPQSYLIDILRNVHYAILVECANFQEEWKRKVHTMMDDHGGYAAGTRSSQPKGSDRTAQGTGQTNTTPQRDYRPLHGYRGVGGQGQFGPGNTGPWWPNPYHGGQYQGGHYSGGAFPVGRHPPLRDWQTEWNDERHPKIKMLMQSYLLHTNGRVHLAKILAAVGKHQTDLTNLPKYVHPTGWPFLSWTSILGRCTYRECRFRKEGGHPLPADIMYEFVKQITDVIGKGVVKFTAHTGGSLPKKQKVGNAGIQN
jgi:hypothetical protein